MKTQHLNLEDGILEFENDMLIISDTEKNKSWGKILIIVSGLLSSVPSVIRSFFKKDYDDLWFFLVLVIIWIGFAIIEIYRRFKPSLIHNKEIPIENIQSIEFTYHRVRQLLTGKIFLKNNTARIITCTLQDLDESVFLDRLNELGVKSSQIKY